MTPKSKKKVPYPPTVQGRISRFWHYFSAIWEGNDGKVSGKRLLGIILVGFAIHITNYGLKHAIDRLDSIIGLVGTILGAALCFWGITAMANAAQDRNRKDCDLPPFD